MNISYAKQVILICILVTLPLHRAIADSFTSTLLRITGINSTPSKARGEKTFIQGNLWLVKINELGTSEPKQLTNDGAYRSPLWIPGSDKILAIKADKLIQLDTDGSEEKIRHRFSDSTILVGFDKRDANSILILQGSTLVPAMFSLANKQITFLPYNIKEDSEDRKVLCGLARSVSSARDYGYIKVLVDSKIRVDAGGYEEEINKIHIKDGEQDTVILCPADCAQPALTEDGRRLIFVGQ